MLFVEHPPMKSLTFSRNMFLVASTETKVDVHIILIYLYMRGLVISFKYKLQYICYLIVYIRTNTQKIETTQYSISKWFVSSHYRSRSICDYIQQPDFNRKLNMKYVPTRY